MTRGRTLSRRTLLSALALLPATAVAPPHARASTKGRSASVVVIGAGMAGVSVAAALQQAGIQTTVLEARNRLGGRIYTDRSWSGIPLDMGASWIHGARTNPLSKLAKEAKLLTLETSYDNSELYISPELKSKGLLSSDTDRWEKILAKAYSWAENQSKDVSVLTALRHIAEPLRLSGLEQADLDFFLAATLATEFGLTADSLSAGTVEQGELFEDDGDDVLFPNGYDQLVKYVASGLTIRTGATVRSIRQQRSSVSVDSSVGSFSADAVVVTVPLGVLKAGAIRFEPGLSKPKTQAIAKLEMGVLSKTFLRFEKAFWPTDVDWHEYLGLPSGQWTEWVSFAKAGAPVLLGFNAGKRGREIEAMEPKDVTKDALGVLRQMFGKNVPEPVATKTSSWSTDTFAYGSYSANVVGVARADRLALAEPQGRLFFAGEATDADYSSTVHGARFSGRRAAKEVLALLK